MVLITFTPTLAKLLIAPREDEIVIIDKVERLEEAVKHGNWDKVPPIWITPNCIFNDLLNGIKAWEWNPSLKPFLMYNGAHRRRTAIEHNLPLKAYIRYTLGNPEMPEEEKLKPHYLS